MICLDFLFLHFPALQIVRLMTEITTITEEITIQQMIYGKKQVGEFYISNILKSYIQAGLKVGHHLIDPNHFDCLGTPEQYEEFIHE